MLRYGRPTIERYTAQKNRTGVKLQSGLLCSKPILSTLPPKNPHFLVSRQNVSKHGPNLTPPEVGAMQTGETLSACNSLGLPEIHN